MTAHVGLLAGGYICALLVLCMLGLPVATVMALIATGGGLLLLGENAVLDIGNLAWSTSNAFLLVSLPMFVLMGELLLRGGLTDRMYQALGVWLAPVPGGLLHTNIAASALFAATSGSSVATAATIGTVALPSLEQRGYSERIALGSIAAGGTLGILIPPSVNMIIYGAMTDTSIGRLFVAGIVPGVVLAGCFMAVIVGLVAFQPGSAGRGDTWPPLAERIALSADLIPIVVVFAVVMGSIYGGFATATEAAALGVVCAVILVAWRGGLSLELLHAAFRSTVRTTGMVMLIVVAAFFMNFIFSLAGIPQAITHWVEELGAGPIATIWVLFLIYLVLGCFLETLSMMITTVPIVAPLVLALGFDPVWFGVFVVLMCELSLITPPIGMNLYVVQGIRKRGKAIDDVILGTLPFVIVLAALSVLLIYFPQIALWLPDLLFGEG